jgi:Kef-type K+ transport system membrane component KefB
LTPFLQLAIALVILIGAAKAGGYFSYRLGQPSVLGELMVGILLGPSVIDILHIPYFTDTHLPEAIHNLAELGVLLLMFIAGLDLHISELARTGKVALLAGIMGVILPLLLGLGVGLMFNQSLEGGVFLGLVLSATSVSISAQTLMELKVIRSRVGVGLLGAAVFDDILVVLGLSIFIALTQSEGGLASIALVVGSMLLFLVVASIIGWWLLPRLSQMVSKLPISQGLIAFTFVTILLFSWLAESMGSMAAVTGAFLAGLLLSRSPAKQNIEHGIATIAYGVFVPLFFINVGLSANARELRGEILLFTVAITLVAILGKVLGAGAGASLGGFSRREALQIGVGMMSRGEVGLIVASVGITQNLIPPETFSAVVGMVIITTLLTPPLLRSLYPKPSSKPVVNAQKIIEGDEL